MNNNQPLFEGLEYKDLVGMMKPTIHVDEFASKMGDDDEIIVLSFFVRSKQAAKDLVNWFEKGYDLCWIQTPAQVKSKLVAILSTWKCADAVLRASTQQS